MRKQHVVWALEAALRLDWTELRGALRGQSPARHSPKWQILNTVMMGRATWGLPPGDYLEFGVYRGQSFKFAYHLARQHQLDMHFYAFDSFEGLPKLDPTDQVIEHFYEGQYACSEDEFKQILINAQVDLQQVTTIPGFYDQSLTPQLKTSLPVQRAAVAWVDCDLYTSTVPVLDFLTDYLDNGSVIIFDDWFSFGGDPRAGELRATREWLVRHPEITLLPYHTFGVSGQSFLVQRHDVPEAAP